jgi:hypothetical protein
VEIVLEQLQKGEDLNVCSVASNGVGEFTVSQQLLWLWKGDSSRTQEGERPPLEAGTRGIVKSQHTNKTQ